MNNSRLSDQNEWRNVGIVIALLAYKGVTMESQRQILQNYLELYANPSMRAIADDTGIQLTRVFRLMNGSKMKFEEYQIFTKKIQLKQGCQLDLQNLFSQFILVMPERAQSELSKLLYRQLELRKLLNSENSKIEMIKCK